MALTQYPEHLNGIPLSTRSRWLLFTPTWMLMPMERKRAQVIDYLKPSSDVFGAELRPQRTFIWPRTVQ